MTERGPSSATSRTGASGAWSARCTSPRPSSRRSRTSIRSRRVRQLHPERDRGAALPRRGQTLDERMAWVNETGLGVIGTPDDAVAQIDRLDEQSGGFGCYLLMHHEWARHDATLRSYELFASHVKPRFQRPPAALGSHGTTGCPAGPNSTSAAAPRSPPPRKGAPRNAPNETEPPTNAQPRPGRRPPPPHASSTA